MELALARDSGRSRSDTHTPVKVLSVVGTRPEAIKMAPLVRALAARGDRAVSRVCVTAQHRGMLDQVLERSSITPDHDLNVMTAQQSSAQVAARVLKRIDPVLAEERPDWVLVQGDTTSAAAAAMAARHAGIKVGHVEAGLRTFDPMQPFPEELNRRVITSMADLHFAPTPVSRANLLREGVDEDRIRVTGNTGIDALYRTVDDLRRAINGNRWASLPAGSRVILATAHRRENLGRPMEEICRALREIAARWIDDVCIVFPVHPRREVRKTADRHLGGQPNVRLVEPVDYRSLVQLMLRSDLVISDSGGLQEEAPAVGKPVLVLRNLTERPEAVAGGSARLVGTVRSRIVEETARLLNDPDAYARMARPAEHFGDGAASERIVGALLGEPLADWKPDAPTDEPVSLRANPFPVIS